MSKNKKSAKKAVNKAKKRDKVFSPRKKLTYKKILKSNDIGCLTAIYNTEKLGKVFMPENAIKREDYAAWLSILKKGIDAYNKWIHFSCFISAFKYYSNKNNNYSYNNSHNHILTPLKCL